MYPTKRTEFVVAFNGARDAYQVALALHERGLLSKLVTDFYTPAPMARLWRRVPRLKKLAHRNAPGLPFSKVRWNASLIDHQYVRALLPLGGYSHHRPRPNLQSVLSRAALRMAEIRRANLLCYAGYAYQAFGSPRSQLMCKGLFQYHPHVDLSSSILSRDLEQHHKLNSSLVQLESAKSDITNLHELHQADFIICASSSSARSVVYAGIPSSKIYVVPYGIDIAREPDKLRTKTTRSDVCRFLFVGAGIHRKGLHHLFHAWRELHARHAHLTVVARYIDAEIASLEPPDGVTVLPAQSDSALRELYETTNIFVLPSLMKVLATYTSRRWLLDAIALVPKTPDFPISDVHNMRALWRLLETLQASSTQCSALTSCSGEGNWTTRQ
jgi:glycosyltransferase involved in cell wall biosynthesis